MIPPMTEVTPSRAGPNNGPQTGLTSDLTAMRNAAQELEATFLAEMLKSAGFGKARDTFGGGAGEEQFASFLRMEQARAMVRAGGIGLSESFFNALKEMTDEQ